MSSPSYFSLLILVLKTFVSIGVLISLCFLAICFIPEIVYALISGRILLGYALTKLGLKARAEATKTEVEEVEEVEGGQS